MVQRRADLQDFSKDYDANYQMGMRAQGGGSSSSSAAGPGAGGGDSGELCKWYCLMLLTVCVCVPQT